MKNLAVDTSGTLPLGRAVSTASLPLQQPPDSAMLSLAPTPSSLNHPQPSRRKSSQLGLKLVTPPSNSPGVQQASHIPPPTPSLVRPNALRHFPSSPLLPLRSPSGPPEGGMQLPPIANPPAAAVGFAQVPALTEDDDITRFDVPQSRELKVAAYPDGPICIYDPHVYLYFEPTAAEASTFGVVLNVASEVLNPFEVKARTATDSRSTLDQKATMGDESPTTPKAGNTPDFQTSNRPEYIHIPWEHNTDIVPELYDLVRLVDERVQDGKRVLIHCQCGVSRSASLIVAYGLYKNPSITVQEAYDAVKRRSKWIGPNMNLIMQLQEFRTELLKSSAGMPSKTKYTKLVPESSMKHHSEVVERQSQDRDRSSVAEDRPRSAPLLPEKPQTSVTLVSNDDARTITPGPSSAPSGFPWPTDQETSSDKEAASNYTTPQESPSAAREFDLIQRKDPSTQESTTSIPQQGAVTNDTGIMQQEPPARVSPFQPQGSASGSRENDSAFVSIVASASNLSGSPEHGQGYEAEPLSLAASPGLPSQHVQPLFNETVFSSKPQDSPGSITKGPALDDTSVSSPRMQTFGTLQPTHNNLRLLSRKSQPLPRLSTQRLSPADSVIAQKPANEFAMTSVVQPPSDDSFGLTSPRATTFTAQLPYHGAPFSNVRATASLALHPGNGSSTSFQPRPLQLQAQESSLIDSASDRATIRSRLGMSTSSSYDMHSEYVLAARARELRPSPVLVPESLNGATSTQNDLAEALMSPRASEITSNPFEQAMALSADKVDTAVVEPEVEEAGTQVPSISTAQAPKPGTGTESSQEVSDPRSPPQRGLSPIVRSIFDVFTR